MERRRFILHLVSAGAGALVLPGWLARAFAQDHATDAPPASTLTLATLSAAYRDAQRLGKPLLVVAVPDEAVAQAPSLWGGDPVGPATHALVEGIVGASPALLEELALTHVACARLSHLRQLVPATPPGLPELVLVETDAVPARAAAVEPHFTPPPHGQPNSRDTSGREAQIDAHVAAVTAALHHALVPTRADLERRAAVARTHLEAATLARLDQALARHAPIDFALADHGAAIVALAADGAPAAVATPLHAALVAAAEKRLRVGDVPGSVWATDGGCGPCGMAIVSARDERFLHFFAQPGFRSGF